MNWRTKIKKDLKEAHNNKCISPELARLAKDLLEGDTKFNLIFSSSRQKFTTLRFDGEIKIGSKKILVIDYGIHLYKHLRS